MTKVIGTVSICIVLMSLTAYAQTDRFKPQVRHDRKLIEFKNEIARGEFTSQPIEVPIESAEPFLAVGAVWDAKVTVSLRGSVDGEDWSGWKSFDLDYDSMSRPGEYAGGLLFFDQRTKFIQYRININREKTIIKRLRLSFISPGATPGEIRENIEKRMLETMSEENLLQSAKYPKPPVITRTEWGCPDGQITTHGALSHTTVTHLIVHHTVNDNNSPDWPAVVRSIWNFHIFDRNYADIGYNYLVDPNGVIYEGRSGGDNVQGAHFSGVNSGTMGVALLGTFTDVTPSQKALTSLKKILAWKADQRNIDPAGTSLHSGSQFNLKNISGHRDGPGSTECPGDSLYALLTAIRNDVKSLITNAGSVASVSAASFKGEALAPDSIVAAFGANLATSTQTADSTPLPTALAGTSVLIRDSFNNEKIAPLFFVSPGQINFLIPSGVSNGPATFVTTNADGRISTGTAIIRSIAPSLFAANSNGQGVAAAVVLRVKADGSQVYEPVAVHDQGQNMFVAAPIDLSPESDEVFLVAYGTGIRYRSSLSSIAGRVGGASLEILYAGEASGFFGLDQINLRLSRSLMGRGEVDLELIVDGQAANVLKVRFK